MGHTGEPTPAENDFEPRITRDYLNRYGLA